VTLSDPTDKSVGYFQPSATPALVEKLDGGLI